MKACRLRYNFNAVFRCFFIFWAIIFYVVRPKINPFIAFCLVCWKVVEFLLTFFFFSYILLFVACQCFNLIFRGVAQLGRALRSGRRGRKFKSCHLDQKKRYQMKGVSFYLLVWTRLELAAGFSEFDEQKRSANLGETVRWTVS